MTPRLRSSLLPLLLLLLLLPLAARGAGLYRAGSDVVKLTDANFEEKVLKADGVIMVEFYSPNCGHCVNLAPEYDRAASALKGVVTVGAVDGTVSQQLMQKYGVRGVPAIKIFGADKRKPEEYKGERTAKGLVAEALSQARALVNKRMKGDSSSSSSSSSSRSSSSSSGNKSSKSDDSGGSNTSGGKVITLTDDNFKETVVGSKDLFLVAFIAPWCGYCKKLQPEWKEAAKRLKGQVKLGWLDATAHQNTASKFDVRGYPTIKIFPAGPKKGMRDYTDYNGPREAEGIVAFAADLLERSDVPPEVNQLTSQALFDETCSGPIICLLAALPHIIDSGKTGRAAYLDTLMDVAKKHRKAPIRIMWTEGGAQPATESALGLTFGFPAVAALSKEKGVYATMKGSFDAQKIGNFITGLTTGKEVTAPLGTTVAIQKVPAWDGQDAPVVEEEEFSLEDILGEEL